MTGIINKTGALKQRIAVSRGTAGGGGGSATFDAIADGSITAGNKCILRSDGKVSALPNIDNNALYGEVYTNGSGVVDDLGGYMKTVYDTVNNKIICLYQSRDAYGTANYQKALMRHGTVNGTTKTITWGDEVVVSYSESYYLNLAFDPTTGVIACFIRDKTVGGNYTYYCTIRTAKINGTGFDLGTQTVVHSSNSSPYAAQYDAEGGRVIMVCGQQSSDKRVYSFTLASDLSFTNHGYINMTNQNFAGASGSVGSAMKPGSDGGMLFCASWKTNGSGEYHPKAIPIYWTGSAYALGTEIFLNEGQSAATAEKFTEMHWARYDPDTGNFVTVRMRGSALGGEYPHPDASDLVSTVVTVGTPMETTLGVKSTVLIHNSSPDPGNGEGYFHDEKPICFGYHEGANRFCIMHIGEGDGYKGWMRMGEIDGTGQIVWGGETGGYNFDDAKRIQDSNGTICPDGIWDPDENQLIMFWDRDAAGTETNKAMYAFIDPEVPNTRLTKYNFIGIAANSVASGGTAKIQLRGQVDDSQSGLTVGTEYFVRKDGSLATTADSHIGSVPAGKALSATQILIKAST